MNTFDVLLECKGELKCEYVVAPMMASFHGGAAATLHVFGKLMNSTPIVGEENCWPFATMSGTWELTPAGIWLIKV